MNDTPRPLGVTESSQGPGPGRQSLMSLAQIRVADILAAARARALSLHEPPAIRAVNQLCLDFAAMYGQLGPPFDQDAFLREANYRGLSDGTTILTARWEPNNQ
jgi:hypothetical protein